MPFGKWNYLKVKVKEFSQQFGKYNKRVKDDQTTTLREKLQYLENQLAKNCDDLETQKEILNCKTELEVLNFKKNEAAKIRSKTQWIEDGEKCTKFFLGLEKSRAVASTVYKVKNENGKMISKEEEIVEVFAQHFERVYNEKIELESQEIENSLDNFLINVTLKQISDSDKSNLDSPITLDEIVSAFKGLNKLSSPGVDGITMQFYEIFLEDIKHVLLEYYNFCFEQIGLCENTQMGLITLIHKGNSLKRDEVGNWRPITLSNIDYKIIAKLLANRLKYVAGSIVGKQQQGFIKGRNIANIIRGIDDVMDYERKNNLNFNHFRHLGMHLYKFDSRHAT